MLKNKQSGTLFGIGVGPGDPELLTLKAARILRDTAIIAFFQKRRAPSELEPNPKGNAYAAAAPHLNLERREMAMVYPVTTEYPVGDLRYDQAITAFYDERAAIIAGELRGGKDVAVLAEGDPFFYGSFMHLFHRLADHHRVMIVPGVTGMSACWTAAMQPITYGDDVLTIIPATLPSEAISSRLQGTDAAVFMKLGHNFSKVRAAIEQNGLLDRAIYVERGSMKGEKIIPLREMHEENVPYFAIILIPGQGRRL